MGRHRDERDNLFIIHVMRVSVFHSPSALVDMIDLVAYSLSFERRRRIEG